MSSNIDMSLDDIVRMNCMKRQEATRGRAGFKRGAIESKSGGGKMMRTFGRSPRMGRERPRIYQVLFKTLCSDVRNFQAP